MSFSQGVIAKDNTSQRQNFSQLHYCRRCTVEMDVSALRCTLPSGRRWCL